MSTEQIDMWRCTQCGKWSHAKRKPKTHRRWVDEEPEDESTVTDYDDGFVPPDGDYAERWEIACGPFAHYRATEVMAGGEQ